MRRRLTSSSSRVIFVNKRAHSFCIPSSIVASGGGATGVGAGGFEDEAVGWIPKNPFGAGTGVEAIGDVVLFGVLNPKKPPGVDAAVGDEEPGVTGDTLGAERAGRGAPAKGVLPTFKGGLGAKDPNDSAERGGVFGLVGLAGAALSSIDSVFN
jgi:hypothetical protein